MGNSLTGHERSLETARVKASESEQSTSIYKSSNTLATAKILHRLYSIVIICSSKKKHLGNIRYSVNKVSQKEISVKLVK